MDAAKMGADDGPILTPPRHDPGTGQFVPTADVIGIINPDDVEPRTLLGAAAAAALDALTRVDEKLIDLRKQRRAINDEIRELVDEQARLTSMVRASKGRATKAKP
jgi:hypothetical protein